MNDGTIPYLGGSSFVGVDFLPAQLGTFRIAQLMGFTGSQLPEPGAPLGAGVSLYSYLDGAVVHLRGFAGHGMNPVQREFLADFLDNCAAPPACPQDLTGDDEVGAGPRAGARDLAAVGRTRDRGRPQRRRTHQRTGPRRAPRLLGSLLRVTVQRGVRTGSISARLSSTAAENSLPSPPSQGISWVT